MIKALLTSTAAIAISLGASADSNYFGDSAYISSMKWDYSYSEDVMTDKVTHYAAVSSLTSPEYSWESPLEIVYLCTDNGNGTSSSGLHFAQKNSFFSINNTTPARIRVEDEDAVRTISGVRIPDNSNDYLYVNGTDNVDNFIQTTVLSERRWEDPSDPTYIPVFYLQFPEFLNGQAHMFVFDGAEDAINRVRRECGLPVVTPLGPEVGIY